MKFSLIYGLLILEDLCLYNNDANWFIDDIPNQKPMNHFKFIKDR